MARHIAVSFENEIIKIVYASLKSGNLIIKKTLVLKNEEFDDFLKNENARHFIVIYDFKSFYQDILLLPPVKKSYIKDIIKTEIRKRSPEFKDFSFFYEMLGEKMHEGRKVYELFVFAVNNDDLSNITDRFERAGKRVLAIYPPAFATAQIVKTSYVSDEPLLYVVETMSSKILFLMKDGHFYFTRDAQSFESGIHDIDVQSINMTINYCRQTLRLVPSKAILIGNACSKYETTMDLLLPVMCIELPPNIIAPREVISDFIIPLSAILNIKGMTYINLLPDSYRNLYKQKTILSYYTLLFLILSVAGLGYIKMQYSDIAAMKKQIELLRSEIRNMDITSSYETKKNEFDKVIPLINFLNTINTSADIQKALIELSSIKEFNKKDLNISSIDMSSVGDKVHIKLNGSVIAANFTAMQKDYQELISAIKKVEGMETIADKIDIKSKDFQIELRYGKK
ncbi:hypothetical protein JZK55_20460 [Dissulfurispira thermophila]|uniref:Uncharacterized protein n=1 Tax=Dissulfurispira thermophila TaxID=2715679 RepID=A0A7G1H2V2_9BACT|nr:hypothetical protein [Dissulfurispira thermophila]BCB97124.1 hypothetical protein JZK55_20460 [Dissulfurispira thermophila]